jgi:type IV pilus assembly protein PilE
MKSSSGFTLIELAIVVVIVGILYAISMPAYMGYTQRAHRSDGQSALLDIASREERYVAQKNSYTLLISEDTNGLGLGRITSPEGHYEMEVAACGSGIATCYLITATAIGGQASDTECAKITYDSLGTKSGTTANCW